MLHLNDWIDRLFFTAENSENKIPFLKIEVTRHVLADLFTLAVQNKTKKHQKLLR